MISSCTGMVIAKPAASRRSIASTNGIPRDSGDEIFASKGRRSAPCPPRQSMNWPLALSLKTTRAWPRSSRIKRGCG